MRLSACLMAALLIGGCGSNADDPASVPIETADRAVTVELPPELPEQQAEPEAVLEQEEAVPDVPEVRPEAAPIVKAEKPKPLPETAPKSAEEAAETSEPPASPADEESAEAAQASEPRLVRTQLPLSEAQVARTIDRIGYACGSVVGADRQDGAGEPVYKISCSSGAAYRGTTRNGRLFFRPWGSRSSRR